MRPPPQYQPNGGIRAMRTYLRIENTMGIGGEGGTTTARPKTWLNRTRGFPLCYFSIFQDFNLWKPRLAVRLPDTRCNNQGGIKLHHTMELPGGL